MAESWMTKVSAVMVKFLLLVRVGFRSQSIRAEGGDSQGDHRVEGDRNSGPLDHHRRQFHGFLSFLMALPGLAGGPFFPALVTSMWFVILTNQLHWVHERSA